jgi:hypothetical protein
MDIDYFVLDPETGEGIGVVTHVDETADGAFGCVAYSDDEGPGTYQWLGGLTLLKPGDASIAFRQSAAREIAHHLVR